MGPYLLMNLFSPIWTPECASSILGEHGRGWGTEEQHRELIISPIWFSLMTPHDQQPATSVQRGGKVVQGEQRSRLCSTLTAMLKPNVNNCCERADYQNLKWINRPSIILKECIAKSISILKMGFRQQWKDVPIQQHHVGTISISWLPEHVKLAASRSMECAGLLQDSFHWASLGRKKIKYQQCVFLKTDGNCVIKTQLDYLKCHHSVCGCTRSLRWSETAALFFPTILSHRSITRVTDIRLKTPTLKNMQLF